MDYREIAGIEYEYENFESEKDLVLYLPFDGSYEGYSYEVIPIFDGPL